MASSLLRVQFEPLPAGKTREEVFRFFDSADGRITDVDLSTDGVAIITFKTTDDADKLLKNPPVFDGVQLTARRCSPKRLTAFMGTLDPTKLPLAAKGPAIPREATSTPDGRAAAGETKGSILRRHSEIPRTKPKPRVQSSNYPSSKPAADVSESDDTRSSKVQTLQAQRNLVDVDENGNDEKLSRKDKKLAADSCASPAVCPSSKPRAKSEHEISISSSSSAVSAPTSSPIDIIDDPSTLMQQLDIEHTKEDANAINFLTNAVTGVYQVEQVISEPDKRGQFVKASTEICIKELELTSETIELIKVLMNVNELDLADYDCHVTCDEQNGKIILTGQSCNEVEIRIREKLDSIVSKMVPVVSRFLQTTKGENWLRTEFRKLGLLSVFCTKDRASLLLAKDEECMCETITVLGDILDSETVFFGNDYFIISEWDELVKTLNSGYMVLVETDFDNQEITIEGSAIEVKTVTSLVNAFIKDSSECSRKVPLTEIAGTLLNKFQSEIRNSVDDELSRLLLRVELVFSPRGIEIVGSEIDALAAEKIIADQYIKSIQEDCLTADELGGSIEDFSRIDSYEAFTVQQLQEKYRCVIRVECSSKHEYRVKSDEALRSASNITVVKGDITRFTDADVLVNSIAAETSDLGKAGVVSLMFRNAGSEALQQEFTKAGAPIWFGSDVTVTGPAGTIRAQKIFHAAVRKYRSENSIKLFTRMISTCLKKAEEENMRSIAFPTVGCGKLQYKSRDVVNCFVEAASGSKLQIYIVAITDELYEEFRKYLTASDKPGVNQLASKVNADSSTPEKPQSVLHICALDANTFTKVIEELKCRCRSQPSVPQVLIEMPIVHPAIAALADEIIRRIQSLQTDELQVIVDAKQSTVTLIGKRKQDISEVKQRILKLITEDILQQRNLSYIKKTRGRDAYLMALSATQYLGFPQYWTNYGVTDLSRAVDRRQPLTKGSWLYNAVEAIVRGTWIPSLAKQRRDAKNLKHRPTSIEVTSIWVNENPQHYTNYQFKLKSLGVRAAKKPFKSIVDLPGEPEIMTKRLTIGSVNDLNDQLISEVNEVYLLHGTSHVDEIVKNGIDSRFSGDKVLFGRGAYFAESSTKSDYYADPKDRGTEGDQPLFMFLARVLLGEPFLCQEARRDLKKSPCSTMGCKKDSCTKHPMCDSVVGTHSSPDTPLYFREFIVYHPEQCYPEFLVQYKRI